MAVSARELTLILRVQSAGANNIRRMSSDLRSLETNSQSFNQRFLNASRAISAVGRQMQLVGGIGTFALGLAANQAAELQSKVTLAATQVRNSVSGVGKQATKDFQGILAQMTKFPTSADDMSTALYDIYSTLNVTGKQGIPILEQLNKAAVAGSLTATEAGSGLLSVLSNFKEIPQTAKGSTDAFNRMFAAVRFGRINMADFSTSLATTAPAANQTGQTFNNLAGSVAFLTRSLGAAKASVGYARLLQQLSNPKMVDGLKQHGISVRDAAGHYKQLDVIMGEINRKFPQLARGQETAQNFFKDLSNQTGTIQASRAFTAIIRNMSGYRDILHKTIGDNNEFKKSYAAMSQSVGVQWQVFLNTLKSIAITVGAAVIPAFIEMSKPIKEAVNWFLQLDPATKSLIGRLLAFGAVATLLVGTFLAVVGVVGSAIAQFTLLAGAAGAVASGFAAYGAFAVLGKTIYDNWHDLSPIFMELGGQLKTVGEDLAKVAMAVYHSDWNAVWANMGNAIKDAIPAVKTALQAIIEVVIQWGKDFVSSTTGIISGALAAMFTASRLRGGGPVGAYGALEKADLLSLVLGKPLGPAGVGITAAKKSADLEKAFKKAGGLQGLAPYVPFMSGRKQDAYMELQRRSKMDTSFRNEVRARIQSNQLAKATAALEEKQLVVRQELNRQLFPVKPGSLEAQFKESRKAYSTARTMAESQSATVAQRAAAREALAANVAGALQFRGPGGAFAKAADIKEVEAAMEGVSKKAGVMEMGVEGAALGFSKMGTSLKTAGSELLNFIGLGFGPWVGGAVLAVGAIYGLKLAMDHFVPSQQAVIAHEAATQKAFGESAQSAREAADSYNQAQDALGNSAAVWRRSVSTLSNAKGGTASYRHALDSLAKSTDAYTKSAEAAKQATADLNSAMTDQVGFINKVPTASFNQVLNPPDFNTVHVRGAKSGGGTGANAPSGGPSKQEVDNWRAAQQVVNAYNANLQTTTKTILGTAAAGQKLSSGEMQAASAIRLIAAQNPQMQTLQKIMAELSPTTQTFVKALGQVPQHLKGFAAFANSVPAAMKPVVEGFMRISHLVPNPAFMGFLTSVADKQGPQAARVIADFVAAMGRLPKKHETALYLNHSDAVRKQIADFIEKFHKLPSEKKIHMFMTGHQKVMQQIDDATKKARKLSKIPVGIRGSNRDPFGGVERSAERAQQKVGQLKAPKVKGIFQYAIKVNGNFNALPQKAGPAAAKARSNINGKLGDLTGIGNASGSSWANGFTAKAKGSAQASVSIMITEFKKTLQIKSPSKRMQKEIGDPILAGILAPLKKKSDIKDAANTAVNNMVDAWNTARQTAQDQMGSLFSGPSFMAANKFPDELQQQIGFGSKVTFKALKADLRGQLHEFSTFQSSLSRLARRRGPTSGFIDAIRQIGPSAQSEITALLHATPRQLRQYVKMWEKTQHQVNNAATRSVTGQIAAWRKQGAAVALGFMSGMQQHEAWMARWIKGLFTNLLHQVKRTHKSHSPSRVYYEEGLNVAKGFELGVQHGMKPLHMHPTMSPVRRWRHHEPLVAHVTNNYYYNTKYEVYAAKNESMLTALRKHDRLVRARG